jgi:predicted amidohydrolase
MRTLLAAMECAKGDPAANLAAHEHALVEAARSGCRIAVFPEMSLSGAVEPATQPQWLLPLSSRYVSGLAALTAKHGVAAVFGIAEAAGDGAAHITQVYADGGSVVGVYRKRHLGEGEEAFLPGRYATGEADSGVTRSRRRSRHRRSHPSPCRIFPARRSRCRRR